MMNYIQHLDEILNTSIAKLQDEPLFGQLLNGKPDPDSYIRFLVQTYHYVMNTSPFLKLTADTLLADSRPMYQRLGERFQEHAREEGEHDQWILADLKNVGAPADIVQQQPAHPAVCAYNEYFRFLATSAHPVAVFGTAFVLEGISERFGTPMAENVLNNSGIPNIAKAITFLKSHGDLDQGHMKALRDVLLLVTDPKDQDAIVLCARVVAQLYCELVRSLA